MQEEKQVSAKSAITCGAMKDALIPIAIVIAGIFVGAGLYFGGGQSTPVAEPAPVAAAPEQPADTKSTPSRPVNIFAVALRHRSRS